MGDHGKLAKTISCALKRSGLASAVTHTTALVSSLAIYKTLFPFSWFSINTDSILKSTHICDFQQKIITGIFV